ncbi:MAG: hypothetical protein O9310_16385 [Leptospiraceae bacterium]|jgi:hypothetical protein|nr:hypothetical protein [Leptospiraceae bacterium]PJD99735.1 MAG: hypothetical protein CK427_15445 [Leptospira sp.]
MEVKTEEYAAYFDEQQQSVVMTGSMRLQNLASYEEIKNVLKEGLDKSSTKLTIDLRNLNFLNSSGITTLSLFIIEARNKKSTPMKVIASAKIAWQTKSVLNFKKLWNDISLEFPDKGPDDDLPEG